MSTILANISNTNVQLTIKERAFVDAYMNNGGNGTQAVILAGYKTKTPSRYATDLLRKRTVQEEISARIQALEDAKIAKPTEIMQFYTSVMRGEVLDQFGIEASIDTRIKAANELAKHQIEIPMKLEQRNATNNIGSITLNFLPRNDDIIDVPSECTT